MMKIILSKRSCKAISRMDAVTRQRIKDAIMKLPSGDIKKLLVHENTYRFRVGTWRVLFSINGSISIEDILPRGEAYKR